MTSHLQRKHPASSRSDELREDRTLWGTLICRLRLAPQASIPVTCAVGIHGAGKLLEPADQEVRPTWEAIIRRCAPELRQGRAGQERARRIFFGRDARSTPTERELDAALVSVQQGRQRFRKID